MESIPSSSSTVHFNNKAIETLNDHLKKNSYSKVFILVDENTHQHCLPQFMGSIQGDHVFEIIEMEPGEIHKNIDTCIQIWEAMSDLEADRKSLLINLGGGVVTDLGGFVASTYKRGINFINVPTTLLAMVDASVGGKTGVDLGTLKNQIGVINQPEMVLVITDFLVTLDKRQLFSGFSEMLKHGLIKNKTYWNTLKSLTSFDHLDLLIHKSVRIKNEVVIKDPMEQSFRKTLNYGHTLGHAIESYFLDNEDREPLLHGEAIAIGMVLEAYLSHKLKGLSKSELEDIKTTFLERFKKVEFSQKEIDEIVSLLKFDKKNSHGNINFVLLKSIGAAAIDVKVPNELFAAAFASYKV